MSTAGPSDPEVVALVEAARVGFASLGAGPETAERALEALERWLSEPSFLVYQGQVRALVAQERWGVLLDSFYRVIPFGTGGRRGAVGVGPNRFNPWTLGSSVQGHARWLRRERGEGPLKVVLAYDVRCFHDLRGELVEGVPSPVRGVRSRDFAEIAAEVYAAADIEVVLPPVGSFLSTPELSFAIRELGADAGLNISASHNHPDDNGGKFYDHTGAQAVPPRDEEMAREVADITHVRRMSLDRARAAGLVTELPEAVHEAYLQANLAVLRDAGAREARVVFTPLHGTAGRTVGAALERAGFDVLVEPDQAAPDGAFPTVPHRAPNPELPGALARARDTAEARGADIVLGCDPDADRLGLMARAVIRDPAATDPVRWRFFTGNEIAALLADYALRTRASTSAPLVVQTEVTSSLVARVARARGARVVRHLLVGFKYIGAALDELERTGRFAGYPASLADFALGAEESHGVLLTPAVRDKDAAGGALLLAELASLEKRAGRTLVDRLEDLWEEVGYVHNVLVSTVMRGAGGKARIEAIQARLRSAPFAQVGDRPVTAVHDRQQEGKPFGPIVSETDRASRDVLVFELGEDARVVVRPSGTEPKTKVYVELAGPPGPTSPAQRRAQAEAADALAADFVRAMLLLVGVDLPAWAARMSGLVPVELKVVVAREVLPELVRRLEAGESGPELERWLDAALSPLGSGARALVAPGIPAFVRETRPSCGGALRALFVD